MPYYQMLLNNPWLEKCSSSSSLGIVISTTLFYLLLLLDDILLFLLLSITFRILYPSWRDSSCMKSSRLVSFIMRDLEIRRVSLYRLSRLIGLDDWLPFNRLYILKDRICWVSERRDSTSCLLGFYLDSTLMNC